MTCSLSSHARPGGRAATEVAAICAMRATAKALVSSLDDDRRQKSSGMDSDSSQIRIPVESRPSKSNVYSAKSSTVRSNRAARALRTFVAERSGTVAVHQSPPGKRMQHTWGFVLLPGASTADTLCTSTLQPSMTPDRGGCHPRRRSLPIRRENPSWCIHTERGFYYTRGSPKVVSVCRE